MAFYSLILQHPIDPEAIEYSPETGKARLGYRPSKKSLKRMVEKSTR